MFGILYAADFDVNDDGEKIDQSGGSFIWEIANNEHHSGISYFIQECGECSDCIIMLTFWLGFDAFGAEE